MYQVIRSNRKTLGLQIRPDGTLVVRAPLRMSEREIREAVERHSDWIAKHRQKAVAAAPEPVDLLSPEALRALADQALQVIPPIAARYADRIGVSYGRITIRNQRSKWGSCSGQGNLNFNCLLMLCPPRVADYVMVHELCHRKEMNHSPRFWAEVARVMPDWQEARNWLKEYGPALIARMPEGE